MEGEEDAPPVDNQDQEAAPVDGAVDGEQPEAEQQKQPAGDEQEEKPAKVALDDLTSADWLQDFLDLHAEGRLSEITKEDLDALDPAAQKVIASIIARGQTAVGSLDEQQASLREKEIELAARERALARRSAANLAWAKDPRLTAFREKYANEKPPEDPFSPEAINYQAQAAALAMFDEFLQALTGAEQAERERFDQMTKEEALEAERQADIAFIEQNQEGFDIPGVVDLCEKLVKENRMSIQEAYEFAMLKVSRENIEEAKEAAKQRARDRVQRGGRAAPRQKVPDKMTPEERALYLNDHPELANRYVEEMFARGNGYG